jgi:DNA-directed RNA polymerase
MENVTEQVIPMVGNKRLYLTQLEFELSMKEAGKRRFQKNIEKANSAGKEDETSYGARIINSYTAPLQEALEMVCKHKTKGRGIHAVPFVENEDMKMIAFMTLKGIVECISKEVPISHVYLRIGRYIEDEIVLKNLKASDLDNYKTLMNAFDKKTSYKLKRDTAMYVFREKGERYAVWEDRDRAAVGTMCYDALCRSVPAFVEEVKLLRMVKNKPKTEIFLRATPSTMDWISDNIEFMQFLAPMYEPMVVQPLAWNQGMTKGGGYISNHIRPLKFVKTRNKKALKLLRTAEMPAVYKAVNAAQDTAWRIRHPLLNLLLKAYKEEIPSLGGLSFTRSEEFPIQPSKEEYPELHREWRKEVHVIREANLRRNSEMMSMFNTLATADKYKTFQKIYMPHQLDFRGRLYCVPNLSPQGADFIKSMLEFGEGKELGTEEGKGWLFVHIANLFGQDKVPFAERIQWVEDNMAELIDSADDPLESRFWESADKPFQALAACYELQGYAQFGLKWKSRMPVALDGSCSGLQNLGMALKCEKTGKTVNLTASDKREDIYLQVADSVTESLEGKCDYSEIINGHTTLDLVCVDKCKEAYFTEAVSPTEAKWLSVWNSVQAVATDEERKERGVLAKVRKKNTQTRAAYQWLVYGVGRSSCKRPVMTYPYGSEAYGFKQQIMDDILKPYLKTTLKKFGVTIHRDLPNEAWEFDGDGFQAAQVLADEIYAAVQKAVVLAAEAMKWLQSTARLIAIEERPITWHTPIGFPVMQDYRNMKVKEMRTHYFGKRYIHSIAEDLLTMDKGRSSNGISPNVVHSLDSTHLMLLVANSIDEGFSSFALIHDSFGVHACDTGRFFHIIRESFLELYDTLDVFEDLHRQFDAQLPPDIHPDDLPTYGTLDRSEILDSLYSFA